MKRREAGFSFIEILVVMGIIVVLVGMVAVIVPRVAESRRRTESISHVRDLCTLLRAHSLEEDWPRLDGKRFTLSPLALRLIKPNWAQPEKALKVFFSPGDRKYGFEAATAERFREVTLATLGQPAQRFNALTSYAGRLNSQDGHRITSYQEEIGAPIICDDDDGELHHSDGVVVGYTDGSADFVKFTKIGMTPPDDPDNPPLFLGPMGEVEFFKDLSSD